MTTWVSVYLSVCVRTHTRALIVLYIAWLSLPPSRSDMKCGRTHTACYTFIQFLNFCTGFHTFYMLHSVRMQVVCEIKAHSISLYVSKSPFAFLICHCSELALVGVLCICIKTDMSHLSLHL